MGNKVSEEFIREFFEENKEKFKILQDSFIGTLLGYKNLPVEDKEIELELHTDKIMLSLGDNIPFLTKVSDPVMMTILIACPIIAGAFAYFRVRKNRLASNA